MPASPSTAATRSWRRSRRPRREGCAFAAPARAAMLGKSPTSQALALRQMALGPAVDFDEALRIEYRIVSRVCRGHDFYEGVRAVIVDKDNRPVLERAAVGGRDRRLFRSARRRRADLPAPASMTYRLRQSRDGAIEFVDGTPAPDGGRDAQLRDRGGRLARPRSSGTCGRSPGSGWRKGLFNWAIILGAFPGLGDFTTMSVAAAGDDRRFRLFRPSGRGRALARRALGRRDLAPVRHGRGGVAGAEPERGLDRLFRRGAQRRPRGRLFPAELARGSRERG